MPRRRPIITLTTDFGLTDFYVAAMKAVLLRLCPDAALVDVTHQIPPQDILSGSINLERAVSAFPQKTVHLAVVDPEVGTRRGLLIGRINGSFIVCPDNGLISWTWQRFGRMPLHHINWRPPTFSSTFHGRDILAPVAAALANGKPPTNFGPKLSDPVLLNVAMAQAQVGQIIHIDGFGNATTNIPLELAAGKTVRFRRRRLGPVRGTYADAHPGEIIPLIGSSDLLEIAVRNGSAAEKLKLRVGDAVQLTN